MGECLCHKLTLQQTGFASRFSLSFLPLLPPVFLLPFHYSFYFDSVDSHPQSAAMPAPTLEFAAICLQNALFLLPPMSVFLASAALTPIEEEGEGSHRPPSIPALPGPPIQGQDIISLR